MQSDVVDYYNKAADKYDELHLGGRDPEHDQAIDLAFNRFLQRDITSVLDVGCGTGRSLHWLATHYPSIQLTGVDPAEAMLDIAKKRVSNARFEIASGANLPFEAGSYDVVIATGILHHVPNSEAVIREMFRVAKRAVLISDHNELAMGSLASRRFRLTLSALGLLPFYHQIRQKGRKARYSIEDGWHYPYSLLDDYGIVEQLSAQVVILPTVIRGNAKGGSLAVRQSHLAFLAWKG